MDCKYGNAYLELQIASVELLDTVMTENFFTSSLYQIIYSLLWTDNLPDI